MDSTINLDSYSTIEKEIKKIEDIFNSYELTGPKKHLLKALAHFEQRTSIYSEDPHFSAIIKWHKSLFLQKTNYFPRAEELLDEAMILLEKRTEPFLLRWKVKIYLSLGHVHRAQSNYVDADYYLKEAVELILLEPLLSEYLGETHYLLADVNLNLNRYTQAKKYITLEKEISYKKHKENKSDSSAIIYAYSLVNFCRIKRLFGLIDPNFMHYIEEAIEIVSKLNYKKGMLKALLEQAEMQYEMKLEDKALETALVLEHEFKEKRMYLELLETGLLVAKIYKTILEYDRAETKLNDLIILSKEKGLDQKQVMADVFFEMGSICYETVRENEAFQYFKQSAKVSMVGGVKRSIIRTFNAARLINKRKAKEFLTSDLVHQDAMFVRDRLEQNISLFTTSKAKVKLFASTIFIDIVGFSSLMRESDENLTVQMIDELIDRLCIIIYLNHGYIDKFLGDGFMAIFEHGDSLNQATAFNAIRAAVDIYRAIRHKSRRLKKVYGLDNSIRVRMGISTGQIYAIFLGNFIKSEFTYLGNSVNLASKLESVATNDFILIDETTYHLLENMVIAERKQIDLPSLGETVAYHFSRLARMRERDQGNQTEVRSHIDKFYPNVAKAEDAASPR